MYTGITIIKAPKLPQILANLDNLQWRYFLYTKKSGPLSTETECLVIDEVQLENDGVSFLGEEGFSRTLTIKNVQGIVQQAKRKLHEASMFELIAALNAFLQKT